MGRLPLSAIDTLILAGGRGRRMGGRSKFALELPSGVTVLEHIEQVAKGVSRRVHVVAPKALHPSLAELVHASLIDDPQTGPANAIVSGARAIDAESVFLLASDLPGISTELLRWLEACRGSEEAAIIPVHEGRPQPLVGLYPREVLAAQDLPPGASVSSLLDRLSWRGVPSDRVPSELVGGLRGFNTWEEAATWGIRRDGPLAKESEPRE